jgi:hypothetical protein
MAYVSSDCIFKTCARVGHSTSSFAPSTSSVHVSSDPQDRQDSHEYLEILEVCAVDTEHWQETNVEILEERDNDYVLIFTDLYGPYEIELDEDKQDDVKAWILIVRDQHILC